MKKNIAKFMITIGIAFTCMSCNLIESETETETQPQKKEVVDNEDNSDNNEESSMIQFGENDSITLPDSKYGIKINKHGDLLAADYDEEESERIYNELSEKEIEAQKSTHFYIGYKKLSEEVTNKLFELKEDHRNYYGLPISWTPYRELLAVGEIKPITNRITLDEVKQLIDTTDNFEEVETKFVERQIVPDRVINEYGGLVKEYWFDDDGEEYIEIFQGSAYEPVSSGNECISYKVKKRTEDRWQTVKNEVLAVYNKDLLKIDSNKELLFYIQGGKAIIPGSKSELKVGINGNLYSADYDEEESERIYNELSEEEKEAQEHLHFYLGYMKLSEEQNKALLEIRRNWRDNSSIIYGWTPYRELLSIGEIKPLESRITLNEAKEIVNNKTSAFDQALIEFVKKQPVPDYISIGESRVWYREYWLNEDGTEYICMTRQFKDKIKSGEYSLDDYCLKNTAGKCSITYVKKKELSESVFETITEETLASYDENMIIDGAMKVK